MRCRIITRARNPRPVRRPRAHPPRKARIRVGAIDAVLAIPPDVERPPVALLIAGSGTTDHDGNGPQIKPATLKKLAEQLAARKIATLRYDKRGAGGWKPEFGRPEDFRFKDYVDDAAALVDYLRGSGKFSKDRPGRAQRGRPGRDPDGAARAGRPPGAAGHRGPAAGRPAQGAARKEACARHVRADRARRSTTSWPARSSIRRRRGCRFRRRCSPASPRHSPKTRSSPLKLIEAADDDRRGRPRPAGGAAGFPGAAAPRRRRPRRCGFPT